MATSTKASTKMAKLMEKGYLLGVMGRSMMANGSKGLRKAMEYGKELKATPT
jgi:hypothetical protein